MDKILIIDDEVGILQLCKRVLESEEIQVTIAADVEKALEFIGQKDEGFDLILTDLKMPGMSGLELLKQIKQFNPETPVILITGQATIESAVEALKSGAYDYILKPFDLNDLSLSVKKCLEHNRLRRKGNILAETLYLYQLSQELNKARSEKELLGFILERALKTLHADAGSIFICDPQNGALQMMAEIGMQEEHTGESKVVEQIAGWVVQQQRPIVFHDGIGTAPQFKGLPVWKGMASSMVVPIENQQILLGVVCLNRLIKKNNFKFTPRDLESLQIFGLHSGLILTSSRQRQTQEEMGEQKSVFVSNVLHEIRTPLMDISRAIELLSSHVSVPMQGGEINKTLDLIAWNTEQMKTLVNDLIDFTRLETGMLKIRYGNVNLKSLIREVLQDLSSRAKEKNISLDIDLPENEVEIVADGEKIRQVIVNIVGNAMKIMPDNGWVRTGFREEEDKNILITVSDSGPGMPKDKQDKIFDRFYQVDRNLPWENIGFGLSLAICKSIVEHHGGRIWVESDKGKGTRYFVRIPRSDPNGADGIPHS